MQACKHFFEKQIDLSIEYAIHIHDKSLLQPKATAKTTKKVMPPMEHHFSI